MIEQTAEKVVVDVPTRFVLNKNILLGVGVGLVVGAGATLAAKKLKERKAKTVTVEVPDAPELP